MSDFSKARAGDSVYSLKDGLGTVKRHEPDTETLLVKFLHDGKTEWFHFDGFSFIRTEYAHPMLYWSRPEIIEPPPPKRKRKVSGWVPIWPDSDNTTGFETGAFYAEKPFLNGTVATIPIEFEVEEEA